MKPVVIPNADAVNASRCTGVREPAPWRAHPSSHSSQSRAPILVPLPATGVECAFCGGHAARRRLPRLEAAIADAPPAAVRMPHLGFVACIYGEPPRPRRLPEAHRSLKE
eukprot:5294578-Prymnesium_polylepis.1